MYAFILFVTVNTAMLVLVSFVAYLSILRQMRLRQQPLPARQIVVLTDHRRTTRQIAPVIPKTRVVSNHIVIRIEPDQDVIRVS